MPLDRIYRLGVLTQNGSKSLEKAAIANGYYEKVPKHSKILIANPTLYHIVVRAGSRIGSIQATNFDVPDALPIGVLFIENNSSWLDFDPTATRATDTHQPGNTATIETVRLQPPDESTSPVAWKLQTDSEQNTDLSPTQRNILGQFILSAASCTPSQLSRYCTQPKDISIISQIYCRHLHSAPRPPRRPLESMPRP
jgi:hypothetical protein